MLWPTSLQALIEDYDAIVSDAKLAPLPRSPTVIEVLKKYEAYVSAPHLHLALGLLPS